MALMKMHFCADQAIESLFFFIQSILITHDFNYLESLFGAKTQNYLELMGGVQKVAVVLLSIFLCLYKHLL